MEGGNNDEHDGSPLSPAASEGGGEADGSRDVKRPRLDPTSGRSVSTGSGGGIASSLDAKLRVGDDGDGCDDGDDPGDMEVDATDKDRSAEEIIPPLPPRPHPLGGLSALRLEAVFHPKFENESQSNAYVRSTILDRVSSGRGYLEVTLKHSGSLLLWSGEDRFYSKNAVDNAFSLVGEVLLRQHFARAWRDEGSGVGGGGCEEGPETKFRECSSYVSSRRLTLSFEVVTSVLGHHGSVPRRDYLVLTAVADLSRGGGGGGRGRGGGAFYSTPELVDFAQKFRLPHNDIWIYNTDGGVRAVLDLYDSTWETAHADGTVASLTDIAQRTGGGGGGGWYIPSVYPHLYFQGNILEGLVMRYVPGDARDAARLAGEAERLLEVVPPNRPPIFDSLTDGGEGAGAPEVLTMDVREVRRRSGCDNEFKFGEALRSVLESSACGTGGDGRRVIRRCRGRDLRTPESISGEDSASPDDGPNDDGGDSGKDDKVDAPAMVGHLLAADSDGDAHPVDWETRRIARLVDTLKNINVPVEYKVYAEVRRRGGGEWRWRYLCVVHVLTDYAFKKYRNAVRGRGGNVKDEGRDEEEDEVMPLYRGFSFRMVFDGEVGEDSGDGGNGGSLVGAGDEEGSSADVINTEKAPSSGGDDDGGNGEEEDGEPLMLKMKLLPYMIRTFCCRNELSALSDSGVDAYDRRCLGRLRSWGASEEAMARWIPFLRGWGRYAASKIAEGRLGICSSSDDLPPPSGARYLEHLDRYGDLFYGGRLADDGSAATEGDEGQPPPFLGLVIVVSLTKSDAAAFADRLAAALGTTKRAAEVNKLTEEDALDSTIPGSGAGGLVCSAVVEDGVRNVRMLLKKHDRTMFLVLAGCGDDEVAATAEVGSKEYKKRAGMLNAWKKCRCRVVAESSGRAADGNSSEFEELVRKLKSESAAVGDDEEEKDDRPGALAFFPVGIPGCGKSALCAAVTAESLRPFLRSTSAPSDAAEKKGSDEVRKERIVVVRIGDDVKEKYWPLVRRERLECPSAVYVADKNAPPAAWDAAEQVCTKTMGVAVPVLPDASALRTETICWEEGNDADGNHSGTALAPSRRRVEEFPLSLAYLAVCMYRVLSRPPGEHMGKLDVGTDGAAMVVIKFYCLYKNLTAEAVESRFARGGAGSAVRVPFFANQGGGEVGPSPPLLPPELDRVLRDAVRLQISVEGKPKKDQKLDSDVVKRMEDRLRALITEHCASLALLAAPLTESCSSFLSQLGERTLALDKLPEMALLGKTEATNGKESNLVEVVSIDVDSNCVRSILNDMAAVDEEVSEFLRNAGGLGIEDNSKGTLKNTGFVEETHVTMVHQSQSSQLEIRSSFGTLEGLAVNVYVTGLLYGEKTAALAVTVPLATSGSPPIPMPQPRNKFPHITVWFAKGARAVESNDLPSLVEKERAQMFQLEEPRPLQGTVSFWKMNDN